MQDVTTSISATTFNGKTPFPLFDIVVKIVPFGFADQLLSCNQFAAKTRVQKITLTAMEALITFPLTISRSPDLHNGSAAAMDSALSCLLLVTMETRLKSARSL